ncbi:hypothetical protein OG474_22625 [Kribbella sp. NBC_01505]|uniref:hypothetical protein n=1 Tax=Kribbella sp. NBC_01505 TaxID=2903580 RepID=UPI0038658D0D
MMMSKKPQPKLLRDAAARTKASAAEQTPATGKRRILSGKNWFVVAVVTTVIGVAIPAVFPRTLDSVRDLWSDEPITVESADASTLMTSVPILATPGTMPTTDDLTKIEDIARQAGGLPAGVSGQRLTLENHRSTKILVTGIRPVIEKHVEPFAGTFVKFFSQGSSQTTVLDLNLDAPQAQPTGRTDSGDPTSEPFFASRNITLEPGEVHPMHLRTVTQRCDCTWRLQVIYRYHDKDRTVLVPAPDKPPFRMTAYAARYQAVYHVDPVGVHPVDPKNYCADQVVCRTTRPSCGTVRTATVRAVVRIEKGPPICKEALRITNRYYNDASLEKQGSGGFANIEGWTCGSSTIATQNETGHLGSCGRGSTTVTMDAT